ncbi:MAG: hypothetical protein GX031_10320 [Candidatus Riflebacteria bacterium]|nr:hypothetical protein [Candidatus Riflebacteria bacterium]
MKKENKISKAEKLADSFLQENAERGFGEGLTLSSFLSRYRFLYKNSLLMNQIKNFCLKKGAIEFYSVKGQKTYYPKEMIEGEKNEIIWKV